MPDITICMTETCPNKEECYRYMAVADQLQSYADFTKECNTTTDKKYYLPMEDKI